MGGTASMQNRRRVDADGKATAGGLGSLSKFWACTLLNGTVRERHLSQARSVIATLDDAQWYDFEQDSDAQCKETHCVMVHR